MELGIDDKFPDRRDEETIERCPGADWCIFEKILSLSSRTYGETRKKIPEKHIHRDLIEELCGRHYDGKCAMKYAAMRAELTPYTAAQIKALEIHALNLETNLDCSAGEWVKEQDLGRGKRESYAERFREVWTLSRREPKNGDEEKDLILRVKGLYEITTSEAETYETLIRGLRMLKQEYNEIISGQKIYLKNNLRRDVA